MLLQIVLEHPHHVFTNFEEVRGKVELWLPEPGTVTSVDVSLEGEATSRVDQIGGDTKSETHKFLQQKKRLWDFYRGDANMKGHYTMAPGNYEWLFCFPFPQSTACEGTSKSIATRLQSLIKGSTKHIDSPLPPSLFSDNRATEILYLVKAEVVTKDIFAKDPRGVQSLNFTPMHSAHLIAPAFPKYWVAFYDGKPGIKVAGPSDSLKNPQSYMKLLVRTSDTPFGICGGYLNLAMWLQEVEVGHAMVFLQSVEVDLIGYTESKVRNASSLRSDRWYIAKQENLALAVDQSNPMKELSQIDEIRGLDISRLKFWNLLPLPADATPNFEICNIKRWYELEVRVGISNEEKSSHGDVEMVLMRLVWPMYSDRVILSTQTRTD